MRRGPPTPTPSMLQLGRGGIGAAPVVDHQVGVDP
jgi:hypothetical protein